MKHKELCRGHIVCPYCNKETCAFPVNIAHFKDGCQQVVTASCLICMRVFDVDDFTPKEKKG